MAGGNPNWNKKKEEGIEVKDAQIVKEEIKAPEEPSIKPEIVEEKEATIPISAVQKMIEEAMAKIPTPQPQVLYQPPVIQQTAYKIEHDINDIPELQDWTMKDRQYVFVDGRKPISESICNQHSQHRSLQYTNKETQTVLPMRYASNQTSFFIEKQSKEPGSVLRTDIIFSYGMLKVPADNILLQKFLHIHPDFNLEFKEYDPSENSRKFLSTRKVRNTAENLALSVGEITNRAIASLICPSYIDAWEPEMVEEQIMLFIEKTPQKYIDYVNDPTLKMKGVAKTALATGDLIYSNYRFMNRNKEVLLEVPKNKDEFEEIAHYFNSGTGRSFYEYLLSSAL